MPAQEAHARRARTCSGTSYDVQSDAAQTAVVSSVLRSSCDGAASSSLHPQAETYIVRPSTQGLQTTDRRKARVAYYCRVIEAIEGLLGWNNTTRLSCVVRSLGTALMRYGGFRTPGLISPVDVDPPGRHHSHVSRSSRGQAPDLGRDDITWASSLPAEYARTLPTDGAGGSVALELARDARGPRGTSWER